MNSIAQHELASLATADHADYCADRARFGEGDECTNRYDNQSPVEIQYTIARFKAVHAARIYRSRRADRQIKPSFERERRIQCPKEF